MLLLLGLAVLLPSLAQAGPWTRSSDSHYAKLGGDWYAPRSFEQVGRGGGLASEDTYFGHQYSLYGEVGLPTAIPTQVSLKLPMSIGHVGFTRKDNGQTASGTATTLRMGDMVLRSQVGLAGDKPVAFALDTKIPLYRNDSICGEYPQFIDVCARPGDNQLDFTGWLLGGASVGKKGWVEASAGYMHRTEVYLGWDTQAVWGDSVVVDGVLGGTYGPVLAMVKVNGNFVVSEPGQTPQAFRAGPTVLVDIAPGLALEARAETEVWATYTSKGLGFGFGISHRQ